MHGQNSQFLKRKQAVILVSVYWLRSGNRKSWVWASLRMDKQFGMVLSPTWNREHKKFQHFAFCSSLCNDCTWIGRILHYKFPCHFQHQHPCLIWPIMRKSSLTSNSYPGLNFRDTHSHTTCIWLAGHRCLVQLVSDKAQVCWYGCDRFYKSHRVHLRCYPVIKGKTRRVKLLLFWLRKKKTGNLVSLRINIHSLSTDHLDCRTGLQGN